MSLTHLRGKLPPCDFEFYNLRFKFLFASSSLNESLDCLYEYDEEVDQVDGCEDKQEALEDPDKDSQSDQSFGICSLVKKVNG